MDSYDHRLTIAFTDVGSLEELLGALLVFRFKLLSLSPSSQFMAPTERNSYINYKELPCTLNESLILIIIIYNHDYSDHGNQQNMRLKENLK